MPNLEELKRYVVVSNSEDESLLKLCMEAAVEWFENAGVQPQASALYDIGVYQLAAHYYDVRGVMNANKVDQIPFGIISIMHQLR